MENQKKLVMKKGENGHFFADVYTYIPNNDYINKLTSKFSGIVKKDSWDGNYTKTFLYKNGKYRLVNPGVRQANERRAVEVCYYWTVKQCDFDLAGNPYNCMLISRDLLYCEIEEDTEVTWLDDETGGGTVINEDCTTPNNALSYSGPVSQVGQQSVGGANYDPATGGKIRYFNAQWTFYKGHIPIINYTWYWKSYVKGIQEDVGNGWEWQSIRHDALGTDGPTLGQTSCSILSQSATFPTPKIARLRLDYQVTICIECFGVNVGCDSETTYSEEPFSITD